MNCRFFVLHKYRDLSHFRISTLWSFCGTLGPPTMLARADARRVTADTSGEGDTNFYLPQNMRIMKTLAGIGISIRYENRINEKQLYCFAPGHPSQSPSLFNLSADPCSCLERCSAQVTLHLTLVSSFSKQSLS